MAIIFIFTSNSISERLFALITRIYIPSRTITLFMIFFTFSCFTIYSSDLDHEEPSNGGL